ncbi:hypothetical protein BU25DRAFT_128073 [Macroventuria anomochaeta]|uniref:Uncharacterized protein n=1 Tax=Macroventuria anomochaeta TaxID=301207 RepID=A0ACB6RT64_9PLEO|nr:uncharacterized protein BU25DRAFT_128073 [Macroventuria anomochaeta]KAF2624887.1 hypothetical protein BU25DRAFT_128073 [Macroventuria anomochaeta]
MSTKILTTILLAAGLAASKPIASPHILQDLARRQDVPAKIDTCASSGSRMISALATLESRAQEEVVQINADNFIIVNIDVNNKDNRDRNEDRAKDGKEDNAQDNKNADANAAREKEEDAAAQQLMLQQVNRALLADQQANAAKNEVDNVLRAMALAQKEPHKSTVLLVVQEIKISIEIEVQVDDEKKEKRKIDTSVFKQEAIVANPGQADTETVMVYDPRTLTATDVPASPEATDAANDTKPAEVPASKTVEAVLYNTRPTYTAIAEDPAAMMRAALEAALEDRQKYENRAKDVELNVEIAVEIKVEIEKDHGQDNGRNNGRNDKDDGKNDGKNDDDRNEDRERERQEKEQQKQDQDERERKQADQQQREQEKKQTEEQDKANKDVEKNRNEAQAKAEQKAKAEQEEAQRKEKANDDANKAKEEQDGIKLTIVQ